MHLLREKTPKMFSIVRFVSVAVILAMSPLARHKPLVCNFYAVLPVIRKKKKKNVDREKPVPKIKQIFERVGGGGAHIATVW